MKDFTRFDNAFDNLETEIFRAGAEGKIDPDTLEKITDALNRFYSEAERLAK